MTDRVNNLIHILVQVEETRGVCGYIWKKKLLDRILPSGTHRDTEEETGLISGAEHISAGWLQPISANVMHAPSRKGNLNAALSARRQAQMIASICIYISISFL